MTAELAVSPLELWGGVECSVVRVGDTWRDQVRETGHHGRGLDDLARIAALGIRTLRYPVLWERVAEEQPDACGWAWHDRQLDALQRHGIGIVAGLLHHGSGPRSTSLLDPLLPERLAAHAARVADRYPFVDLWVPVNEPLTTARFSCLYGHWYPHLHDEAAFLRAVVTQCRAVLLSMRAIRARVGNAHFLQTEDIGRVFSTAPLTDQAGYENGRRWLSLDLLCGRVDRRHPWRRALEKCGIPVAWLDELRTGEAAPDVLGINHYVTSDRFLDHRLRLYPASMHGGNGRQAYVDTEAVRVGLAQGETGWVPRLREVWDRYRRPMVIGEAHLGCDDPDESVRWLAEAWHAAGTLRADGADVRAVTAWALFGLVDWHVLLRERHDLYEPGAFDARFKPPRPTRIVAAMEAFVRDGNFVDPALDSPGWWRAPMG
ncbi:MAG: family 1 glycosylhydrolase [Janthinobacterium lividum]